MPRLPPPPPTRIPPSQPPKPTPSSSLSGAPPPSTPLLRSNTIFARRRRTKLYVGAIVVVTVCSALVGAGIKSRQQAGESRTQGQTQTPLRHNLGEGSRGTEKVTDTDAVGFGVGGARDTRPDVSTELGVARRIEMLQRNRDVLCRQKRVLEGKIGVVKGRLAERELRLRDGEERGVSLGGEGRGEG